MHIVLVLQLLILLAIANGSPVLVKYFLRSWLAYPLDGGALFVDGRRLLGASKTIRGVLIAALATTAVAPLLGLDWRVGFTVGIVAMAGDLFSSFIKRRLAMEPSSKATGLDQIPESLFPTLACWQVLSLTVLDVLAVAVIFFVGEILLSRVLFKWHLRDRPY
jgi:CDP-2,3-bis-(O-geranylgeranyl)-sn-glycerol synthase